jgi:DNA-binding NtrC family response regulator
MAPSATPGRRPKRPPPKPKPGTAGPRSAGRLQRAIDASVTREIEAALRETAGNVTRSAAALGITRAALIGRLRSLGIDAAAYRG